tara:strand:+ start:904 stop:1434 length:531 start_codon:yes stop_codon:yes gene_type:complete
MCELIASINGINCDEAGGVDTWYAYSLYDGTTGASNVDTLTIVDGEVTALTLVALKYAYPINVEQETSSATDTAVGERANGSYAREQASVLMLHGNTKEMIVSIEQMCQGRTVLIAKLNDGTYELFFSKYGAKLLDERATGTAFEDMNGTTLNFAGKETYKAPKIDSAIVLALLEP